MLGFALKECARWEKERGGGARRSSLPARHLELLLPLPTAPVRGAGARLQLGISSASVRHQLGIPLLPGCPQLLSRARKWTHAAQRCGRRDIAVLAKSIAARELNFDI